MKQISNFQLFCILLNLTAITGFVLYPNTLAIHGGNNAWLASLLAIVPGIMLVYLYLYILKKSSRPFPLLLEDCCGKIVGKFLGLLYSLMFFVAAAVTLDVFVNFIESNVLPNTPISVFVGGMIVASFYTVRKGLQTLARMTELAAIIVATFTLFILLTVLTQGADIRNLLPIGQVKIEQFAIAWFESFYSLGYIMVILVLAFYSSARKDVGSTAIKAMLTYIFYITLACIVSIVVIGVYHSTYLTYPTFILTRRITIGEFIQNIDAVFIALWTLAIYSAIAILWFLSCYVLQKTLALKDYRFLAGPQTVILGIGSLMVAPNIVALRYINQYIFPLIHFAFFVVIPIIIAIILIFKPVPANNGLTSPLIDQNQLEEPVN
ncbi:MAG: GerAB/ArcD/ProY family transporter [Syntrophomonadaceae bacterium]|jgi:spore germination protein KB